jgi:hypothetical protein
VRVDARDVLDPNAKTLRAFRAQIVGYFRRVGPNSWDDYQLVREDGGELIVNTKLRVQVEDHGVELRMRKDGRVIRVRWLPTDDERDALRKASPQELREHFCGEYLDLFANARGAGAAAVIAQKLRS